MGIIIRFENHISSAERALDIPHGATDKEIAVSVANLFNKAIADTAKANPVTLFMKHDDMSEGMKAQWLDTLSGVKNQVRVEFNYEESYEYHKEIRLKAGHAYFDMINTARKNGEQVPLAGIKVIEAANKQFAHNDDVINTAKSVIESLKLSRLHSKELSDEINKELNSRLFATIRDADKSTILDTAPKAWQQLIFNHFEKKQSRHADSDLSR